MWDLLNKANDTTEFLNLRRTKRSCWYFTIQWNEENIRAQLSEVLQVFQNMTGRPLYSIEEEEKGRVILFKLSKAKFKAINKN